MLSAMFSGSLSRSSDSIDFLLKLEGRVEDHKPVERGYHSTVQIGEWESPVVTGNRPPPISGFTIESLSKNTALLFGGATSFGHNSCVYIVTFTRKVKFVKISNPGGSVKWPSGRSAHSSVIINHGSSGQHLLVIGVNDCWVLDIINKTWKEVVTLPDVVTKRNNHSLSAWSVTPATTWIVQFGGYKGRKMIGDTTIIEFRYNAENDWSVDVIPPDQYQDKLRERKQEWEESQVIHRQRDKIIEQSQTEQGIIEERLQPLDHEEVREQSKRDQQNKEQNHQGHQEQNTDELLVLEQKFLEQLQEKEKEFERVIQEKDEELRKVKNESQEREQELLKQLQQAESSWVLDKEEITITEGLVGKGSWGEVKVGIYCGLRVAAKRLHDVIISHYNISTFSREMNIASKVRHPNLLQFIGATKEGNPIILTELMHTSLRKELETSSTMPYHVVLSISLDVACALNYLHLFKPHPILHRDVSSPNVLLQPVGNGWRAKLSDYGSANLQHLIGFTVNPGSPIYSAPEATNPHNHSPAMDVYSFAVLLIEMLTCQLPEPKERQTQLSTAVKDHVTIRQLLVTCLNNEYESRPNMSDVIRELKREI
uniref:Protein kinase domain-containing protein n=1 Tax=Amphimedon queenslandica TaxID=400682 RepID=A0A1X7UPJ3_AMPQE